MIDSHHLFLSTLFTVLQKGLENEKKLNDNYMRKKYGQKVNFGDIIQVCASVLVI